MVEQEFTSPEFCRFGYDELTACAIDTFRKAQSTRADVLLLEHQGKRAVLKDYTHSSRGFARLVAPYLVKKETRALDLLRDADGVPRHYCNVNRHAFVMEYLEARRIRDVLDSLDIEEFVTKVENLVKDLHDRGVAHGDLRNATNIMVRRDNEPVIVDFGSAFHRGHPLNPVSLWLFCMCKRIDRGALAKLKKKYAPALLSAKDVAT